MPWDMGPIIGCRRRAFRDCSGFMGCLGVEPMAGKAWDRGGLGRNMRKIEKGIKGAGGM